MGIAKKLSNGARTIERGIGRLRFTPRQLDSPVRVAVVGTGKAARYHLDALEQIRGTSVSCLVNRGGSDPTPLMQRHGIPRCHVGVEASLARRDFDVAIVAVTPSSIPDVASAYLSAGVHCLIEKPLGVTLQDGAEVVEAAAESDATAAVGFNRRCYSSVLAAARYVDAWGAPYAIHVDSPERFERLREAGEDPDLTRLRIVTNTCHAIDLFTVFAGEHDAVVGTGSSHFHGDVPVDYAAMIRFRKGQTGVFSSHWTSPGDRTATLYGRGYKLVIDLVRNELSVTRNKKAVRIGPALVDRIFKPGVYHQDAEFLEAALAGEPSRPPLASVEDAFATQRLSLDLLDLAASGGQ